MREISSSLLAEQQKSTAKPYLVVKLVSPDGATTYEYDTYQNNRILSIDQTEGDYVGSATIKLNNSDGALTNIDFRGYRATIGYGFITITANPLELLLLTDELELYTLDFHTLWFGLEHSNLAQMFVKQSQNESSEGQLVKTLICMDLWAKLADMVVVSSADRIDGTLTGTFPDNSTVYEFDNQTPPVLTGRTAKFLSQGTGCIAVLAISENFVNGNRCGNANVWADCTAKITNLTFTPGGFSTALSWHRTIPIKNMISHLLSGITTLTIDIADGDLPASKVNYQPKVVFRNEANIRQIFRTLIDMTRAGLRLRQDGMHLIYLDPDYPGSSVYTYDSAHNFRTNLISKSLVIPNVIKVVDRVGTVETVYNIFGQAEDTDSTSRIGEIAMILDAQAKGDIQDINEAQDRAESVLAKKRIEASRGEVLAPMHCGQEVYDYIRVIDSRLNVTSYGWITELRRRYNYRKGIYDINLVCGGTLGEEAQELWREISGSHNYHLLSPAVQQQIDSDQLAAETVGTGNIVDDAVSSAKLAHNIDATAIGFNADKVDGKNAEDLFADSLIMGLIQ